MTHTRYFLFQIVSFKKYFYVSLGNIFYCFLWRSPTCGGSGQLPSLPPLKSGPVVVFEIRAQAQLSVAVRRAVGGGVLAVVLANLLYVGIGGACVLVVVAALAVAFCRCLKRQTPPAIR